MYVYIYAVTYVPLGSSMEKRKRTDVLTLRLVSSSRRHLIILVTKILNYKYE